MGSATALAPPLDASGAAAMPVAEQQYQSKSAQSVLVSDPLEHVAVRRKPQSRNKNHRQTADTCNEANEVQTCSTIPADRNELCPDTRLSQAASCTLPCALDRWLPRTNTLITQEISSAPLSPLASVRSLVGLSDTSLLSTAPSQRLQAIGSSAHWQQNVDFYRKPFA